MALSIYSIATWGLHAWFAADTLAGSALAQIVLAGGVGSVLYVGLSMLLRVEALGFFSSALLQRVRRREH
jgi:hypothetical protein